MTDFERFDREFASRHRAMRLMFRLSILLIFLAAIVLIATAALKR